MLAEFVAAIAGMTMDGQGFEAFTTADRRQFIRLPDGSVERVDEVPPDFIFDTPDLDSFATAIMARQIDKVQPLICVGSDAVIGFVDPTKRRDRFKLRLHRSAELQSLMALGSPTKQKEAVKILRDDLFDACDAGLLPAVRSLDFTRRNDGGRTIEHGRESLGKSIENKVQSKNGEVQERYQFRVPIFATPFDDTVFDFACTVDLDAANETIRINITGDQIIVALQRATKNASHTIAELLPSATVVIGVVGS